jgi:hypothetical protein
MLLDPWHAQNDPMVSGIRDIKLNPFIMSVMR